MKIVDWDLLTHDEINQLNNQSQNNSFYYVFDRLNDCTTEDFNQDWEYSLREANDFLDKFLPIVKNIFPKFTLPKESIKNVFEGYNETIQKLLKAIDFDTSLQASNELKDIVENDRINKINNFFNAIYDEDDGLETKKESIYRQIKELGEKDRKFQQQTGRIKYLLLKSFWRF